MGVHEVVGPKAPVSAERWTVGIDEQSEYLPYLQWVKISQLRFHHRQAPRLGADTRPVARMRSDGDHLDTRQVATNKASMCFRMKRIRNSIYHIAIPKTLAHRRAYECRFC